MKQKLRRIFVNSLAVLLVFALALTANASSVKAEDATELTNIKVTDFNLTTTDVKTPEDGFYSYIACSSQSLAMRVLMVIH